MAFFDGGLGRPWGLEKPLGDIVASPFIDNTL